MNDLIKEYKIYELQKDYDWYATYLLNLQYHIELCNSINVINNNERNNYLKLITDYIRDLNTTYNISTIKIRDSELTDIKLSKLLLTSKNFKHVNELINIHKVYDKNYTPEPFKYMRKNILDEFGTNIGFYNIYDGLSLIININFEKMYNKETKEYLKLYNKIFIPLTYKLTSDNMIEDKNIYISVKKSDRYTNTLISDYISIIIRRFDHPDKFVIFDGIFKQDPLNIIVRTSQICNNFIYKKKKELEDQLNNISVNKKFSKYYLKNASLSDILVLDNDEFCEKMSKDYANYLKITKLSFRKIMKEFIRNDDLDINHMFSTIKLLLHGNDEKINIAGLLLDISKDKKPESDFLISEMIYKNLSFLMQIKINKSIVNIQDEMEKIKNISPETIDMKKQVAINKNMPYNVKVAVLEKLKEIKMSNNDYAKQLLYVKTALNFPWPSKDDNTFFNDLHNDNEKSIKFLDEAMEKLDNKVYGHKECKLTIKEEMGKWISNPNSAGSVICLHGPPGVGKTLIAKALGDVLDMEVKQITVAGHENAGILYGHEYTYGAAQPGMLIKKINEAGTTRCIIYIDELDKTSKNKDGNDQIQQLLISIFDPNTNEDFGDKFFQEFGFPIGNVMFITTCNDIYKLNAVLRDRLKKIKVKPYQLVDKRKITKQFIIKEMSTLIGLEYGTVTINDDNIDFIVDKYTAEPGVRELKRRIEKIFLKLNIDNIYKKGVFDKKNYSKDNPIEINRELIKKYLGEKHNKIKSIHTEDIVGIVNGLYATECGKGGILPIQIYINYEGSDNKFMLKFTGNQKEVMKESVISAFTTAMHIVNPSIREKYLQKNPYGFHVHLPEIAVPKDGPSAGAAFTTGFVSRIVNKKIKNNIAMTGEIELTGNITKIGGLEYKIIGAKQAGVKTIFVPRENEEDVKQFEKDYVGIINNDFKIIFVDNIKEILEQVLIDFTPDIF